MSSENSETSQAQAPGHIETKWCQSECFKAFRPIFAVLFLCGIDVTGYDRYRYIRLIYTYTMRLILVLSQIAASYSIILIVMLKIKSVGMASFHITALLIVFQVFVVYVIMTLKWTKIRAFFVDFCMTCSAIMGYESKVYRSTKIIIKGSVVLIVVSFAIFTWAAYSHSGHRAFRTTEVNSSHFLFLGVDETPAFYPTLYTMVVFSTCFHMVFVLWYLNVCFILIKSFQSLRKITSDGDVGTSARAVASKASTLLTKKVVKFHRSLCLMVQTLDDIFQEIVCIWHFSEVTSTIFILRAMNLNMPNAASSFDYSQVAIIVVCLVVFVLQAVVASYINNEVVDSLKIVTNVDEGAIREFWTMDRRLTFMSTIETKSQLYSFYVTIDPPGLTGWGLYVVRKGFILAAAANILTYVLVLYGIQDRSTLPSDKDILLQLHQEES